MSIQSESQKKKKSFICVFNCVFLPSFHLGVMYLNFDVHTHFVVRDEALCSTPKKFCFFTSLFSLVLYQGIPRRRSFIILVCYLQEVPAGSTQFLGNTQRKFPVRYCQLGIQTPPISCWNCLSSADGAHLGASFNYYAFIKIMPWLIAPLENVRMDA